jgi:enoyl-CoA hydratase
MLLTGDTVDGRTAEKMAHLPGGVTKLDKTVDALAKRMAGVPKNQLMMQKLMINQAYENMGLASTQMMATLFDGITRHSPEGVWFKNYAEKHGFHAAVKWRDSGKAIP